MSKIKTRIYFLFLINLTLISYCQNQCDSPACQKDGNQCKGEYCDSTKCKPNMFSSKCYYCEDCTSATQFYQINEGGNTCTPKSECTLIIEGSNQCVESCGNYFKLGSYCYRDCTGNMQPKDGVGRECECNGYYSIENIGGKTLYHCYGGNCDSEFSYKDLETKECSNNSCSGKRRMIGNGITRCSLTCQENEKLNKDENLCLTECPSNKQYYYLDDNGEYICTSNCEEKGLYIKEGDTECKSIHECAFVSVIGSERKCLDSCLHNYGSKECVESCTGEYPYEDTDSSTCYANCPTKYVKEGDQYKCENDISDCFFTNTNEYDLNKICYKNGCPNSHPNQIFNTKKCVNGCSSDYIYVFNENQKICYSSCDSIPFIGKNYYEIDQKCFCYLYGLKDDETYKCYDSEIASFNDGFRFKQGRQALLKCEPDKFKYIVNKTEGERKLDVCYESYTDCKTKDLPYYNHETYECFSTLPQDGQYYPNEYDSSTKLPKEDNNHNTYYLDKCGPDLRKLTLSGVCKLDCDDNEYYVFNNINNYYVCKKCDGENEYISEDGKECKSECEHYYYIDELDNNKKKCVENCKDIGKFFYNGDKKCYDSCTKNNKNFFYKTNNECVESCRGNADGEYAYDVDNGPQKCIPLPEGKYYKETSEHKYIIQDTPCTYYDINDAQKCVDDYCNGYKIYHDRCVNECPDLAGPYKTTSITGTDYNKDECVPECPSGTTLQQYTNLCVSNSQCANYDGKCYPICNTPNDKFNPDPIVLACTNNCNYYETIGSNIKICKSKCEGEKKYIKSSADKECVAECQSTNNVLGLDNVCTTECSSGYKMDARNTLVSQYECMDRCPTENNYFYDDHNKCVKECPSGKNFIIENTFNCIPSCPNDYYYYKDEKITIGNSFYYKCTKHFKCGFDQYFCIDGCYSGSYIKTTLRYDYIENNRCISACTNSQSKKQKEHYTDDDIFICKEECDPNEYVYGNECVDKCPSGKYIGLNNKCENDCSTSGTRKFNYLFDQTNNVYKCVDKCPDDFPYSDDLNNCDNKCSSTTYLSKEENHCYDKCIDSTLNQYTLEATENGETVRKCLYTCNDPNNYDFKYSENKNCQKKCSNENPFAIEITNECVQSCGSGYFSYIDNSLANTVQKKFCVKECPTFRDGNNCVDACNSNSANKFYVKEYLHGELILEKECKSSCPGEYPFFYKDSANGYACVEKCENGHYYTKSDDPTKFNNLCLPTCNSDYKYKVESEESRICYDKCPSGKQFHKENDEDNNCYARCPPDAPYTEDVIITDNDYYICKTYAQCNKGWADFNTKKCLQNNQCPSVSTNPLKLKQRSLYNGINICLNKCMSPYGEYSTYYDICVNNCVNDPLFNNENKNLMKDPYNPECICENLFYINNGKIICFPNSNKECRDMDNYKYNLYGTKQCIQDCNSIGGILSPTEDICHQGSYNCSDYPNSIKDDSNKKCVCKDKYYIDSNRNKVCLKEGDVCPDGYQEKYVPSIKQCVEDGEECPSSYGYLFIGKYCLSNCPTGSTDNKCNNCTQYWKFNNNSDVECLSECNVYIPSENNKCVTKCEGQYSYYYDGECYSSCNLTLSPEIRIKDAIEVIDPDDLSKYKCECKKEDFWYIENDIKYCVSSCFLDSKKFNYVVKETSQCVNACSSTTNPSYPYYFNNECFSSCENEAKKKYHLTVKTDAIDSSNYECQCDYLWHYKDSDKKVKECINENICILSNTTKKFFSPSKNECVEKCIDNGEQGFNYICYDICPPKTKTNIDSEKIFDCFCDLELGYWFEYEQYNGIYYSCALDECPLFHEKTEDDTYVRMNLIESEKKCVKSCRKEGSSKNENFFALRGICIKGCPDLTYTNDDNDVCLFYELNDTDINSLDKFKRAANVQAKELYEKSQNLGGFLYNKFNTSLEIYAVDLKNTLKDISFKSNLTYIDFDTCIKKIFERHNKDYLNESLTILVAKYDLLPDANINIGKAGSNSDKYLINPVEYELFSSNKSEKLDASVCSPYELIISFPLLLNKFDNYEGDINKNELRKKFEMGKKLYHMDNSIDTFNYNNYIYNTFCKGLEINGKDLLYQDRYKYLYPNGKILCESNCTMNNTDFELERINCLCSYKNVFDFNRIEKETNDILNDPSFIVPTQSSLNAEAIKCLFNFTLKQTTYNNGAFYYCSVSLLVQISMVIVSATYGIKSALSNVRHLLNRENFNDNNIGRRIQFKEKDLNNDKIMTTNRPLNHPPKKKDVKEKYNEDIDLDSNIENDEFNNTILENDLDSNNNEGGNYEINLKKGNKDNKENNNNPLLDSKESINGMKVEYIPPDYNFKFFKPNDKGVIKKIDRSKIPFEINPDTRYLLERKKGIEYPENYLNGPYFQEQNIVIITDEKNNDVNKVVNYIKKEKLQKNNPKPKNDNNDNNKNIKEEIKADYNIKKRNNLVGDNKSLSEKGEKNLILIKKINKDEFEYSEESLLKEFDEKDDLKLKIGELGLLSSIKREQVFLRVSYEKYISKQHSDIFCVYLAEILDKIYLAKICLFLKKIDIFPIHFSLYMFCHLLLLSILTGIFSIKLIKKIWDEENFPNFKFYVLYGLIINIIIWIIYQIFLCLLDNRDKVKVLIITKNELIEAEKNGQENMNEINYNIFIDKYNSYKSQVKCKITVFYIIVFLVSLFLTIYLISFFALYTGTKRRVLKAYYISIVEILLIKFVYGFALCSLRLASKVNKIRCLYNIVCFLNKYVS